MPHDRNAGVRAVRARGRCAYCGTEQGPFTVDHIVPLCRGGPDRPGNWACCCTRCNQEKGGLLVEGVGRARRRASPATAYTNGPCVNSCCRGPRVRAKEG